MFAQLQDLQFDSACQDCGGICVPRRVDGEEGFYPDSSNYSLLHTTMCLIRTDTTHWVAPSEVLITSNCGCGCTVHPCTDPGYHAGLQDAVISRVGTVLTLDIPYFFHGSVDVGTMTPSGSVDIPNDYTAFNPCTVLAKNGKATITFICSGTC